MKDGMALNDSKSENKVPSMAIPSPRLETDPHFIVQWDEHPTHLATRLGYLLEQQSLVDVTLMCNTHTLRVHRAVLAACSPYFERQLGNHPLIVLKDMKFSVLKCLVEFMYCGETSVAEENLTPLLEAAKFFEVKGLSAMTKESLCNSSNSRTLKVNGNGIPVNTPQTQTPPHTPLFSRGNSSSNRGRGRGRGRPPMGPVTKINSPTESAQILLSLSGSNTTSPPQLFNSNKTVKIDPKVTPSTSNKIVNNIDHNNTLFDNKLIRTMDNNIVIDCPKKRGRKRSAINTAIREHFRKESDSGTYSMENLSDNEQINSPLLTSLLMKRDGNKLNNVDKNYKYLKDINLSTNVPVLYGNGKLVKINDDVLKNAVNNDSIQFQVNDTGFNENSLDINTNSSGNSSLSGKDAVFIKGDGENELENKLQMKAATSNSGVELSDSTIESLKASVASDGGSDPNNVVLFEVTGGKNIQKYVLSEEEVNTLKHLNEQLSKKKKELSDLKKGGENSLSEIELAAKEDLQFEIDSIKSQLAEILGRAKGGPDSSISSDTLENSNNPVQSEDKRQSQVVQLEFIDGNGEKIEGYQVEGTVVKNQILREQEPKDSDILGFFETMCRNSAGNSLMEENELKKTDVKSVLLDNDSSDDCVNLLQTNNSKDINYQLVMNNNLDDQSVSMPYDQIEAMMNDPSNNIVIESKNSDFKYIIGSDSNIMNTEDGYVVYNSGKGMDSNEYVIYDGADAVLADMRDDHNNTDNFTVGDDNHVIQNDDGTEYIVYDDKNDLSSRLNVIDEGGDNGQFIVYEDNLKKEPEDYEMCTEIKQANCDEELSVMYSESNSALESHDSNDIADPLTNLLADTGGGSGVEDDTTKNVHKKPHLNNSRIDKLQMLINQRKSCRSNSLSSNPDSIGGRSRTSSESSDSTAPNIKRARLEETSPLPDLTES